ncbi:MAG: cell division protein ZapA [Pseudomonadota bacterium]
MTEVDIRINGRDYKITCDAGQEERLRELAHYFNRKVGEIAEDVGQIGDARLMLLSALTICDELFDLQNRAEGFASAADELDVATMGGAARAVEAATSRVNAIAERLDDA